MTKGSCMCGAINYEYSGFSFPQVLLSLIINSYSPGEPQLTALCHCKDWYRANTPVSRIPPTACLINERKRKTPLTNPFKPLAKNGLVQHIPPTFWSHARTSPSLKVLPSTTTWSETRAKTTTTSFAEVNFYPYPLPSFPPFPSSKPNSLISKTFFSFFPHQDCGSSLYTALDVLPDVYCVKSGGLDDAEARDFKVGVEFYTKDRVGYSAEVEGAKQEKVFG